VSPRLHHFLSVSINRYHRVRPGTSRVQQLTRGTRSLVFPVAQLVHCRHSWHPGVIISPLLLPQLVPCLLSHRPFPMTCQVGGNKSQRCLFRPLCHFINHLVVSILLLSCIRIAQWCSHSTISALEFNWENVCYLAVQHCCGDLEFQICRFRQTMKPIYFS